MTRTARIILVALLVVGGSLAFPARSRLTRAAAVSATVDFATTVDYPLVKTKFAVYNSCIVPLSQYNRDINLINEIKPESLRIDGALGESPYCGLTQHPVTGTATALQYNFAQLDQLATLLDRRNVLPYWSYDYEPYPLQINGDYRSPPSNLNAWKQALSAISAHFRQNNLPVGYHEIWNEPDYGTTFFTGSESDYLNMYNYGVTGLRAGDPDAVVGGLSSANQTAWLPSYLDYLTQNGLPSDFVSIHHYPSNYDEPSEIASYLTSVKGYFANRPSFNNTEIHLNEYNSYPINYPQGGPQDKYPLASSLLQDFSYFLSQPYLTKVNWAQFMDSGQGNYSGMVSLDGHRKAVFNAYKIYAMMPVDRRQVTISGPTGMGGMASTDGHKASFVVWNKTGSDQTMSALLNNVPFPTGTVNVYRIDASHASWGDNPANENLTPTETYNGVNTAGWSWSGTIPSDGVVYFDVSDGTSYSSLDPDAAAAVIRVNHYTPDRNTSAYAEFDRRTWQAWLGMGNNQFADKEVGVTAEQLPPALNVTTKVDGTLVKNDANSCACVRLDYMVNGAYTKGVLFHGPYNGSVDLYDSGRSAPMPFGTGRQADQIVALPNLAAFQINPAAYAPSGWGGRLQITYIFQNAGNNARWKATIRGGSVGYWKLDDGSGTTAVDSSGNGNNGTVSGATWVAGTYGGALNFNGTSNYVSMGNPTALNLGTGSFSVATWFKTTASGFQRLVTKGNYGNTNGYLLANSSGTVVFSVGAGGSQANTVAVNTPSGFNNGAWHHVAATVDQATKTLRVYVDGVAQTLSVGTGYCGTTSGTTVSFATCPINATSSDPFTLGSYNGTTEFFPGALDDVRVYNHALAAQEVQDIRAGL